MEQWSAGDDRPYVRPQEPAPRWWLVGVVLALAVIAGAFWFWWLGREQAPEPPPLPTVQRSQPAAPQAPAQEQAPAPGQPSAEASKPLPTLDNSDAMMRDTVSGLVGRKAFEAMVYPSQMVRRIVATVDNLPRETAPRRVMPLERVPGAFGVAGAGEDLSISAANAARYGPYVRVFESLDSRTLVQRYVDSYPLFQRAYAELGFPNRSFHARLLQAIDDLLAAPELKAPAKLVQPKILYQYADADLEGRSAGQKIMMRMGPENAAKVKAKLREIRRELTAR